MMGLLQYVRSRVHGWTAPPQPQPQSKPQYVYNVPPELFAEIRRLREEASWLNDLTTESQFMYGTDGTIQQATQSQGDPAAAQFGYKWAYARCLFRPGYGSAFYINEMEHRIIRARSRAFCSQNPYWHGTQRHMKTHVVGSGHTWKLVARDPKSPPSKDAMRLGQKELDDFYHGEGVYLGDGSYRSYQLEKMDRGSRDGEHFLEFLEDRFSGDVKLEIQFVEPLLVWTPGTQPDDPAMEALMGILFRKGRYEKPRGYYVRRADIHGSTLGDAERPLPPDRIQRRTCNVDRSTPRGIPDTYWIQSRLEQAMRTLSATGTLVQVRAKVAMIAKRVNALAGAVQPVLSANAIAQLTGPNGQVTNVMGLNEGSVINSSDQVEYQFPSPNLDIDQITMGIQADLQSASQSLGLADYMISGSLGNGQSYAGCHDSDTELLTRRGWLRHEDIRDDDIAGTMNPDTHEFEWQPILAIHRSHYRGNMIHAKTRSHDFMVTPNHRMFVRMGHRNGRWVFTTAAELNPHDEIPYRTKPKAGIPLTSFTIPGATYRRNLPMGPSESHPEGHVLKQREDVTLDADTLMGFLGWWISEGWASTRLHGGSRAKAKGYANLRYEVGVSQATFHTLECSDIDSLYARLPWHASTSIRSDRGKSPVKAWHIRDKSLWAWLRDNCGPNSRGKRLPDFVHDMPASQQALMLRTLQLGDGSDETPYGGYGNVYTTVSKRLADDIQSLAIQCGHNVRLSRNCIGLYRLRIGRKTEASTLRPSQCVPVPYDGTVWCVTVRNSILITRRNGVMAITGNSMIAESPMRKNFEERQQGMKEEDREVAWRVLMIGHQAGRVPDDVLLACKLEQEGPSLAGRDEIQVAQANHIKWQDGVLSTTTWQMEAGLDPETENTNIMDQTEEKAHRDALAARAQAAVAGMLPGAEQIEAGIIAANNPADQNDGTQKARNKQGSTARPFKPDDEGRQKQRASGATREEELPEVETFPNYCEKHKVHFEARGVCLKCEADKYRSREASNVE